MSIGDKVAKGVCMCVYIPRFPENGCLGWFAFAPIRLFEFLENDTIRPCILWDKWHLRDVTLLTRTEQAVSAVLCLLALSAKPKPKNRNKANWCQKRTIF